MNINLLLAILEYKEIITEEQAEKLAESFTQGIQSAHYRDAKKLVAKLLAEE